MNDVISAIRSSRILGSILLATALALLAGIPVHVAHRHAAEATAIEPLLHWARDSALSVPFALMAVAVADRLCARRWSTRLGWTGVAAGLFAAISIPGNLAHAWIFVGSLDGGLQHLITDTAQFFWGSVVAAALLSTIALRRRPAPRFPLPSWQSSLRLGALGVCAVVFMAFLFAPLQVEERVDVPFGQMQLLQIDQQMGLSAEDLGGMDHGVADLVGVELVGIDAAMSFTNTTDSPMPFDPTDLEIQTGDGRGFRPVSGTADSGTLPAGASINFRARFALPRDNSQVFLVHRPRGEATSARYSVGRLPAPPDPSLLGGGHAASGVEVTASGVDEAAAAGPLGTAGAPVAAAAGPVAAANVPVATAVPDTHDHGSIVGSDSHGVVGAAPPAPWADITALAAVIRGSLRGLPTAVPPRIIATALVLLAIMAIAGGSRQVLRQTEYPGRSRGVRPRTVIAGVAALGMLGILPVAPAPSAVAQPSSATSPCPSQAPTVSFDVQAIDVEIPLNRFGDYDALGRMYALTEEIPAIRAQEASGEVTLGLKDDPIQPLVIRANMGDCVEIAFTNSTDVGAVGLQVDGLIFDVPSTGAAVGVNPSMAVDPGATRTYRMYVPDEVTLEGAHYIHPGAGSREDVAHGLFGALVVEPPGSTYLHPETGEEVRSGWEAIIRPADNASFREGVKIFHEVGNEAYDIPNRLGDVLPTIDPITGAYRPGSRGLNYRSEPFNRRLVEDERLQSLAYNSYAFGDPATPILRSYLADPTKIRTVHAGSEVFHVYHLHGGGIRWRANPNADPDFNYADTGLLKRPLALSRSTRLDSQSLGPGEAFDMQIEGGAGGVQQTVGDLLYHCHIAHHYVAGMWGLWRVYDSLQPDFLPLPDQPAPPGAVTSAELIGLTMPGGTEITADNLDQWIRPQLPPPGVPGDHDASVWDWTIDTTDPTAPVYLGEPEDTTPWNNRDDFVAGHANSRLGDTFVDDRPVLRFNPQNGRPVYPLFRTHLGKRPPFTGNGHSGAPALGETADTAPTSEVDPYAFRPDGLCPANSDTTDFDLVHVERPMQITAAGATDGAGIQFVHARDVPAVRDGTHPIDPLVLRANVGECTALTLVSEQEDGVNMPFAKADIHIHHVQFDVQGSDGASAGMTYEQAVRPYKIVDPQLVEPALAGDNELVLTDVSKFNVETWIGVGLGTEELEIHQIIAIDPLTNTLTLDDVLATDHAADEWAGVEFVQYRWFPDVELDNVFFHDHVDGIHGWGRGGVGQFLVEPDGSTYHDPTTGEEIDHGPIADIRTTTALIPGVVDGSFREYALQMMGTNPATGGDTFNNRAEPWADRLADNPDPSLLFSSWTHGDPYTPTPRAYPGDPVVIRASAAMQGVDTFHIQGHRFVLESRLIDETTGSYLATANDGLVLGVSERFTMVLDGGAGGPLGQPGDYLYFNGIAEKFRSGAWGLLRVLPERVDDLQPLPGQPEPPPATPREPQVQTGGRPPEGHNYASPCPTEAPLRVFDIAAVDFDNADKGYKAAFVPRADAFRVASGLMTPEPLVMHVAAGECVQVFFTNMRQRAHSSFAANEVVTTDGSQGVNAGFNLEQTVAPGNSRLYRFYVDTDSVGSSVISDFGGDPFSFIEGGNRPEQVDSGPDGLYGALVVAPYRATFSDPVTGERRQLGSQVDVTLPDGTGYRDFTLVFYEEDNQIGADRMPYPILADPPVLVNYTNLLDNAVRPDGPEPFAGADLPTPLLQAYAGDPVRVHAVGAPGGEQMHVLSLGGQSWRSDPSLPGAQEITSQSFGPWINVDARIIGGAGGRGRTLGDYFYGDLRRPFALAGFWGVMRTLSDPTCPIRPLPGLDCLGQESLANDTTPVDPVPGPTDVPTPPEPGAGASGGTPPVAAGPGPSTGPGAGPTSEPTEPPEVDVPVATETEQPGRSLVVSRLSGPDRIATAVVVSQANYEDGAAGAVVIARSDDFADALAGVPLAVQQDAPLLLTGPAALHPQTAAELARVLRRGGTVYLLGGQAALSRSVQEAILDAGFTVVRLAGRNRFETSVAIAEDGMTNVSSLLVATGLDFPDALAAGAAAASTGGAVLLSNGDVLTPDVAEILQANDGRSVYAIGGPASGAVPRARALVGANRFGTAALVASELFVRPTDVGLASGDVFPDALSGGVYMGSRGGPILLSSRDSLAPETRDWINQHAEQIRTMTVFGGEAALSSAVVGQAQAAATS